ncbi:MAG: ATP-binding cassette domain-containing protein [Christensenellales bacterium]|jgi:multidrug/hemolysin transport system ATP-binding protein
MDTNNAENAEKPVLEKNIIKVTDLHKYFGDIKAVDGISFEVIKGSLFAFLGTNGAGKSTTISIISTLLKKTSGTVEVNGKLIDSEDEKIRQDIGVVFQDNLLDPLLTVKENLLVRGRLYGLTKGEILNRMDYLAEAIDTKDFLNQRYGTLSGGQKRRADMVRALINYPKILILDEPTTGLDPSTRRKVWQIIEKLKQEKELTIFLTTHYMEEAAIADKIVVINKGKIVAEGTPEELRLEFSNDRLHLIYKKEALKKLKSAIKKFAYREDRDKIIVDLDDSMSAVDILNQVKEYINAFEVIRGNMDDAFININLRCENASNI